MKEVSPAISEIVVPAKKDVYAHALLSWRAALIALALICLVFPDVIFQGASLRVTDQLAASELFHSQPVPAISLLFSHKRRWWESYNDTGGSVYQLEPMIEFMRYCIWHHQSPYWNPYSAAGQLGPETLVDEKFSLFTVVNAILGGGTYAYNITLLLLYFFGAYLSYQIAREILRVSHIAGIGMGIFYLLNGFIVANAASNVATNYLFMPFCLYLSLIFMERQTTIRLVGVILSFAALLSCTFVPTTIALMISIYVILLGFGFMLKKRTPSIRYSQIAKILSLHMLCVVAAFLLLSFLFFPIIESFPTTKVLEMYAHRGFFSINWPGILSLFTTSHFFQSYNAAETDSVGFVGGTVYHFGVIALALAGCAFVRRKDFTALTICCLAIVILILCREFNVWVVANFVSYIPLLGKIAVQYFWVAMVFPMMFLVGIGANNLEEGTAPRIPVFIIMGIALVTAVGIYHTYGLHSYKIGALVWLAILMLITTIAIIKIPNIQNSRHRQIILAGLISLMFIQLTIDSKFLRFKRIDAFAIPSEVLYIKKHIGLYRTMTLGNSAFVHGLRPELGSVFQVPEISSLNEGGIPEYVKYFNKAISLGGNYTHLDPMFPLLMHALDQPKLNKINWTDIDLLGVKYIIIPTYFTNYQTTFRKMGFPAVYKNFFNTVYKNPHVLPRAFSIALPHSENASAITLPKGFRTKIHPAQITLYQNTDVQITGNVKKSMLLVLTDNWEKNWRATVNGNAAPIIKVNEIFRGVWIPAGHFTLNMNYRPRSLNIALGISTSMLTFIFLLLLLRQKVDLYLQKKEIFNRNHY